jgi:hypothetical protein
MYNLYTARLRRRITRGCIGGLVVIVLIVGGLGFLLFRVHNGVTVSVGAHPTIIGKDCSGSIVVRAGQPNQVVLDGVFPLYNEDAAGSIIELTSCDNGITMTVPPQTNLQIGIADAISVFGVRGTMNLDVNGGRITLIDCTLEGQSKLDDNGGAIIFSGDLAQGSSSDISANSGSIDTTLPSTTAFHLEISGILGPLTSNYTEISTPGTLSGSDLQADIGHPNAGITLKLDVNDTAMVLHKVNVFPDANSGQERQRQ